MITVKVEIDITNILVCLFCFLNVNQHFFRTNVEEFELSHSHIINSQIFSTPLRNITSFERNLTEPTNGGHFANIITDKTKLYTIIYTLFILASICLAIARSMIFYKISMNASKGLHNKMFSCILTAPMRFFDTNPSGKQFSFL